MSSRRSISYYPGEEGQPLHWVLPVAARGGRYLTACGKLCPRDWRPGPLYRVSGAVYLECPACKRALFESESKRLKEERGMYERRP